MGDGEDLRRIEKRVGGSEFDRSGPLIQTARGAGTKLKVAKIKVLPSGSVTTYTVRECDADGNEVGSNITGVKNLSSDVPEIGEKVFIARDKDWCFQI
jgi:hypothetical protein